LFRSHGGPSIGDFSDSEPWAYVPANVPLLGGLLPRNLHACHPFPLVHEVTHGETLVSIARAYGIPDWRLLYHHPDNEWFIEWHPDPNRIFPGDRIVIPPPEGEIDCER
jgi:hypothetical protein